MTQFKANAPELVKNKHVSYGNTNYNHADLAQVATVIAESLSKYGVSHSWSIEQVEGKIKVTCTLRHCKGFSESVTMEAAPDNSGQKNQVQAVASSVTYLQRYTLLSITGLAARDMDDDGKGTETNQELADEIEAMCGASTIEGLQADFKSLCNKYKDNASAQKAIIAAKDELKLS